MDVHGEIPTYNLSDDLQWYRAALTFEIGNVPIETLCLPPAINTILRREGYLRVRDLLGVKLEGINGIGRNRAERLGNSLRKFFAYSL